MRLRPKRGRKAKPKYARLDAGQTDDIKRPYRLGTPLVTSLYWKSFKGKKITSVVRFQTSCCPDWATSIRVICDEGPEIINERKTQPLPKNKESIYVPMRNRILDLMASAPRLKVTLIFSLFVFNQTSCMAMVALNVLSLLFVHGALPKKSTVWAFSFYFNNVTLRFRKLFCYWSQILNLGSNSDTFTNVRNVVR